MRHVARVLERGEGVEIGFNGLFGTISDGCRAAADRYYDPVVYVNPAGGIDRYEVVLTNRRLLAMRAAFPSRDLLTVALSCDRQIAQATLVRRGLLFDRLQVAFKDGSLSVTVQKALRREVDRLIEALSG
jgi:hypothetical protein